MSDYQIEDGVPIPPKVYRSSLQFVQLLDLQPGQSFAVPKEKDKALRCAVSNFSARHPEFKFTVRKQPDGRTRVWRLPLEGQANPPAKPRQPASGLEDVPSLNRAAAKPPIMTPGRARRVSGSRY